MLVGGQGDVLPAVPTLGTNILAAVPTLRPYSEIKLSYHRYQKYGKLNEMFGIWTTEYDIN